MNDTDLAAALRAIHREAAAIADPPTLRARVLAIPTERPRGSPRRWGRSMRRRESRQSATRLIAAVAIVALGSGALFLAAGQGPTLLPTFVPSPSPTATRWRLPAGLVTEPVELGVERIVGDSAGHDFSGASIRSVAFAPDGATWMLGPSALFQVDAPGSNPGLPEPNVHYDLTVSPDGTLWAIDGSSVASFIDGTWTSVPQGPGPVEALEVLPDGSVWARWLRAIGRLDGDTWSISSFADADTWLPEQDDSTGPGTFVSTPHGDVWAAISKGGGDAGPTTPRAGGLARFDGSSWELVRPLGGIDDPFTGPLAAAPDGTLWVHLLPGRVPYLARYDGTTWAVFGPDDGVEKVGAPGFWSGQMVVDGNGALWVPYPDHVNHTIDLASFDGNAWTTRWPSPPDEFWSLTAAPDGSVWVTGESGVFIVRP